MSPEITAFLSAIGAVTGLISLIVAFHTRGRVVDVSIRASMLEEHEATGFAERVLKATWVSPFRPGTTPRQAVDLWNRCRESVPVSFSEAPNPNGPGFTRLVVTETRGAAWVDKDTQTPLVRVRDRDYPIALAVLNVRFDSPIFRRSDDRDDGDDGGQP